MANLTRLRAQPPRRTKAQTGSRTPNLLFTKQALCHIELLGQINSETFVILRNLRGFVVTSKLETGFEPAWGIRPADLQSAAFASQPLEQKNREP